MAFLVFEGLDGSGKSTLISGIKAEIEASGQKVIVTREPGGTPIGEEIRQLLLTTKGAAPTPRCELLLYQAIRAQHVETVISPALQQKTWVLCDRYTASSLAFQGGARGLKMEDVEWLNSFSTSALKPDLTLLLDLSVDEAKRRLNQRYQNKDGEGLDRFELEDEKFHQRVRDSYLEQAKAKHDGGQSKWLVLNSTENPEMLLNHATSHLRQLGWLK